MSKRITPIFIIIILLYSGCKQKERIVIQRLRNTMDTEELEKIIFRDAKEIRTIKLNKIKLEILLNDEKYILNSTIGIIRDSIIVISLVPLLGYEIARVYCTTDSLFIIDRQNKNVYSTRIDEQLRKDSIRGDYRFVQSILMNQAVIYDSAEKNAVLMKNVIKEGNYYYYTIEQLQGKNIVYKQTFKIREESFLKENIMVTDYIFKKELSIKYSDFQDIKQFVFPKEIGVVMTDRVNTLTIQLRIGNIEVNEEINAGINIPKNYYQIKI